LKWFKHFTDAKSDTKIRRLMKKYGIVGYGLYFAVIESIAYQIKPEKPIPDLEDNSQDICDLFDNNFYKLTPQIVEEILLFCMTEGLFQQDENTGRIICLKLLCHLDNTMSNNPEISKIVSNFNKLQEIEKTSINLKQIRLDEIRLDKKRERELITPVKDAESVKITETEYSTLCTDFGKNIIDTKIYSLDTYISNGGPKKPYKNHYKTILNWLRRDGIKKIESNICPKCKKVMTLSEWGKPICNCDRG
jgi:hypothetical protein